MINGNPTDFLDTVYSCQDIIYKYNNIEYWFQGYMPSENTVHMEVMQYKPIDNECVWEHNGSSVDECLQAFISAPIFNGKTFWEAEPEIEWKD